jgi:crotonobetainyl-CoA:carnitine CoA-transferase CaiB-like acyl-CoA transferase
VGVDGRTAPLAGLVVADFSRVLAGPAATMLLADLGADVIKVERPEGDDTRHWGPPWAADGTSTYFQAVNRNKRSIVLDLGDPRDLELARRLAARADVLVENFRPGTMERMGLGHDELLAANPGLVSCSITGFGAGEGAELPGYDLLVQAVGGLMGITGPLGGPPTKVGVALVDVLAGLFSTVGILAALRERDASGRGQRVEVSLMSSLLAALINQASGYLGAGFVPGPLGNRHPSIAPYESFAAADGELVVAVGTDRQFASLCEVLGLDELPADERFATNPQRVANADALRGLLEPVLRRSPRADWSERLNAVGVPCGRVNDVGEAFALAERLGLAPVVDMGGGVRQVADPIRLSGTPVAYRTPPPALGADGAEIRAWLADGPPHPS